MKYLFGPVNSRRLGISLGVDLVPYKTCTLNCVYCECGATSKLTSDIAEYVPTEAVLDELDRFLAASPRLDAITFSGSGEPTLHSGIGAIINHLKKKFPRYKIVVLTNSTLLWNPDVRRAISGADIVVPSLDAVSADAFSKIGRPARDITPEKVIDGLVRFRNEYKGLIYLEIFIIPGINDTELELAKLKEACVTIHPDRIQINSLDRPGAEDWVEPLDRHALEAIRDFFKPLETDIIGKPVARLSAGRHASDLMKSIVNVLSRRPSTMEDILVALDADTADLKTTLDAMMASGMVAVERLERGDFYRMV